MATALRRDAFILYNDLAEVPTDVELCKLADCEEDGLHAAHARASHRGGRPKTFTCTCGRNVATGTTCVCQKDNP